MVDDNSRKYPVQVVIASYSLLIFFLSIVLFFLIAFNVTTSFIKIVSFVLLFFIFVTPVLSLICGIIALLKIHNDSSLKGKGIAISSIIVPGIIIIIIAIFLLVSIPKPHPVSGSMPIKEPDAATANSINPITLSRQNMVIYPGEKTVVRINLFNLINQTMYETQPYISCPSLGDKFSSLTLKKEINNGSSASYSVILETSKDTPIGKDLCSVCVKDSSSNGECNKAYVPVDLVLDVRN